MQQSDSTRSFESFAPDFYELVKNFPDFSLAHGLSAADLAALEKNLQFQFTPMLKNFLGATSRLTMNGLAIDSANFAVIALPQTEALLLGEFYLRHAADRLFMLPNDESVHYLEQHNGATTKLAADLREFFNSFLPRCL